MLAYRYPGNIRELKNICERLVVMKEGGRVGLKDLPAGIAPRQIGKSPLNFFSGEKNLFRILEKFERNVLAEALDTHGTQVKMAAALGVNQSTIARKLRKYGFDSSMAD
jgi:TyrR family helix-turn-helix protein